MDKKHKIIAIGNTAVGKTSIINQFVYGATTAQHQPTVGIDFFAKVVTVGDAPIRLQLWDTAGQEKFHSLIPTYIRTSSVALLVYDITNRQTFDDLKQWHKMVLDTSAPALFVVGNKLDLEASRAVPAEEAKAWAQSVSATYFETSAMTPLNIQELFLAVAEIPLPDDAGGAAEPQPVVQKVNLEDVVTPKKSGGCC
jgi:Ras-related protein Rab-6A